MVFMNVLRKSPAQRRFHVFRKFFPTFRTALVYFSVIKCRGNVCGDMGTWPFSDWMGRGRECITLIYKAILRSVLFSTYREYRMLAILQTIYPTAFGEADVFGRLPSSI
jgi:hypothetical protein